MLSSNRMKPRTSLIRKKSAQNKVYIPANNRENQYLLVEFDLSEQVLTELLTAGRAQGDTLAQFYLDVKQHFFKCCKLNGINNAMFVAQDRLVRVRFGEESQLIETAEQLIVFYDPKRHQGFRSSYNKSLLVSKLVLAVFATGDDIRQQAVRLHQNTLQMVNDLAQVLGIAKHLFKIRDHQHITYELFAADKGLKSTKTHGLRFVADRYRQQALALPTELKHNGYVVARLPIPMHLIEQAENNIAAEQPYQALYKSMIRTLTDVADTHEVNKMAVMANGCQPIVRTNQDQQIQVADELVYLSFGDDEEQEYIADWDSVNLVDAMMLIFKPCQQDIEHHAFGKYLNKINQVLKVMANVLGLEPEVDDVMVRFHQNLQYRLSQKETE